VRKTKSSIHGGIQAALLCAVFGTSCGGDSPEALTAAGKKSIASGQYSAAVVQFKSALEKDPKSTETRFLLGQTLLESGDPKAASDNLSKAYEQGYEPEKVLPLLAQSLFLTGEFKKLVSTFGSRTLKDPAAEASLKSVVAEAWAALGDAAKSDVALKAALAAAPDYAPARLLQARLVAAQGDPVRALALADGILSSSPKFYEAWMFKSELQVQSGDVKGADESCQKVLELQPTYDPAFSALISRNLIRGDLAAAEVLLAKMKTVLPGRPATSLAEAQVAYSKREFLKARDLAQQLLRIAPEHIAVLQLSGAIEAQIGSPVVAETQFAKALQLNPALLSTRLNLGQVYLRLGQPAKVLEVVQPLLGAKSESAQAHALAAEAHLRLGNAAAAEAEFKRAAALDPADSRPAVSLALTRLSRGDAAAGLAELQSLSAKSKDLYPDLAMVSARIKRGEGGAALAAIEAMDRKRPNEAAVSELRGRVLLEQQKSKEAREAFVQALKLDPSMYSATAQLAALDIREGQPEQARQRYESSIKSDPANFYPRLALAALQRRTGATRETVEATLNSAISASPNAAAPRLMLIDFMLKERRFKDAMAQAGNATAALPNDTAVLDAAGRTAMLSGNVEQAANTFRRLSNLVPTSAVPWLRLADLYKSEGRRDAAETALKKAIELEPLNAVARQNLLELLVNAKRESEAIEIGRARQRQQPGDPSGYLFEAVTMVRMKNTDAAVAVMRKGLKAVPDGTELAPVLYTMLVNAGRDAEAERFATEWIKEHPDDVGFDYHVSTAQLKRGEFSKAEVRLARILAKRPDNALALNNMAWILVQTGRPGALPLARRAVESMPDDPVSLDTLAAALAAEKQYARALEVQRHAIESAPADNSLRLSLARIAIQAGDKTLARKELEALQGLGATFPQQAEVVKLQKSL
jgi:putative PEP-CTERM system TPR-repeat lipoprotein